MLAAPTPRPAHGQPGEYTVPIQIQLFPDIVIRGQVCLRCGAFVHRNDLHDAFHVRIGY